MPKIAAEFEALLSANVAAEDLARINMPVRLILGSKTKATARRVTEVLSNELPDVERITVEGAGHLSAAMEADRINPLFAEHVFAMLERQYYAAA